MHIQALSDLGIEILEECHTLDPEEVKGIPEPYHCGTLLKNSFPTNKEKACPQDKQLTKTAFIKAFVKNKKSSFITLKFPSVGTTENILLCAAFSGIEVQLNNAAREPEIVALQNFLNGIGAKIKGAGTTHISISPSTVMMGTDSQKKYKYSTPSDRIECGTYLIAGAICGGKLTFNNNTLSNQSTLLNILKKAILFDVKNTQTTIFFTPNPTISDLFVTTPFPGIPTDLQSPLSAFFCTVNGKNYIVESIFQNRVAHLEELKKMGAKISRRKNCFIIEGQTSLHGAKVISKDLRGGAALILAGIGAIGKTEIIDNSYITRGYANIEAQLSKLGADITKKQVES